MPALKKFCLKPLDSQTACTFCRACPETLIHLLIECDFSQRIWQYIAQVIQRFSNRKPILNQSLISMDVPKQEKPYTEYIVLLVTISKHTLWKIRNQVRYERKQNTHRKAIARIKQSVKYRLTLESKREIPVNEGIL